MSYRDVTLTVDGDVETLRETGQLTADIPSMIIQHPLVCSNTSNSQYKTTDIIYRISLFFSCC